MLERGHLWWHERWYSICSAHMMTQKDTCNLCATGQWRNTWKHNIGHLVYLYCYPLWLWWVNRPNSPTRKFLEETFPNLNRTDLEDDWEQEDEILLTDEVVDVDRHKEG
jgi:hypothetical protein